MTLSNNPYIKNNSFYFVVNKSLHQKPIFFFLLKLLFISSAINVNLM